MINNFPRQDERARARPVWRVLAWGAKALVISIMGACIVGIIYVFILAMTISVPVK